MRRRRRVVAWLGADDAADGAADGAARSSTSTGRWSRPAFVDAHVHATETGLALPAGPRRRAASPSACAASRRTPRATRPARARPRLGRDRAGPRAGHRPGRAGPGVVRRPVVYLARVDVHSAVVLLGTARRRARAAPTRPGLGHDGRVEREAHHAAAGRAAIRDAPTQRRAAQQATRGPRPRAGHRLPARDRRAATSPARTTSPGLLALAGRASPARDVLGYWGELGGRSNGPASSGALGAGRRPVRRRRDRLAHRVPAPAVRRRRTRRGHAYLTAAQVRDHVVACTQAGLQAGFHVDRRRGGGGGGRPASGRRPRRSAPDAVRAARHRLEHVEMVDAA